MDHAGLWDTERWAVTVLPTSVFFFKKARRQEGDRHRGQKNLSDKERFLVDS